MKADQLVDRKQRAVKITGALLVGYVLALLVIGYLGRQQLLASGVNRQQLLLDKQAAALGYFFEVRRDDLRSLAASREFSTYLANRALGMSMQYGLADSLFKLKQRLETLRRDRRIAGRPIYLSLEIQDQQGNQITLSGEEPAGSSGPPWKAIAPTLRVGAKPGQLELMQPLAYRDQVVGRLLAQVDFSQAAKSLLGPVSDLVLTRGDKTLWHAGHKPDPHQGPLLQMSQEALGGEWLQAEVPGSGLTLRRLMMPASGGGLLLSPWLGLALLFLAFLLLLTFYHAVRQRLRYLQLRSRLREKLAQQQVLNTRNARLLQEIERRIDAERKLEYRANYDQLTGLPNRTLVLDRLSQALLRAERHGDRVVVLFIDLDHFKQVNDSMGHAAGDELLKAAGERLQALVRESDTVARLGGDEFLILLSELSDNRNAEGVSEKILAALARPFLIQGQEFFVSASIGISGYPDDGQDADTLLKNADIALYRVKEEGRQGYRFYSPSMNARARERLMMESELRHALERQELQLHYQPVLDLHSGRVVGVEALLRWNNPMLGHVSPDRFIPVLEETGMLREVGEWVLCRALQDIGGLDPLCRLSVAVNVSGIQLKPGQHFVAMVDRQLRDTAFPADRLLLEITEGMLLEDGEDIQQTLTGLRDLGCRLSLDDFGTGYSSLGYLKKFGFDQLKIDRSFVHDLLLGTGDPALLRAILALGKAMRLPVVAEGVEQEQQAVWLKAEGCDLAQGFLYSPALPLAELVHFLRTWDESAKECKGRWRELENPEKEPGVT